MARQHKHSRELEGASQLAAKRHAPGNPGSKIQAQMGGSTGQSFRLRGYAAIQDGGAQPPHIARLSAAGLVRQKHCHLVGPCKHGNRSLPGSLGYVPGTTNCAAPRCMNCSCNWQPRLSRCCSKLLRRRSSGGAADHHKRYKVLLVVADEQHVQAAEAQSMP